MNADKVIGKLREFYFSKNLIWVIFAAGVFLRLRQYLCDRSLWIDEAALAVNFVERSFSGLLLPLKYGQMAPLGFVMTEKLAVVLLGPSELALRFFPLAAGLAAMALFYRVSVRLLEPQAVPFALGLFAVHQPLIYFSSEVKPYIFDVALILALVWLTLRLLEKPPQSFRQVIAYGSAGALAVWFSFSAMFVLAAMVLTIVFHFYRKRQRVFGPLIAIFCFWFASALVSYLFVRPQLSTEINHHLQDYWKDAFMAVTPSMQSAKWYAHTFLYLFRYPGGFILYPLAALACAAGAVSFVRKKRFAEFGILVGPFAVTLLASAVHEYPFSDRLILFLVPLLIILISQGAFQIKRYLDRYHRALGVGFLAVLLGIPVGKAMLRAVEPITREEIRPAIDYVRKFSRPADTLYVYNGSRKAFEYYMLLNPLPQTAIIGVKSQNNGPAYVQDLKKLEGRPRVWIIFSHDWSGNQPTKALTLNYLDKAGRRLDEFVVPAHGAIGLYAQESAVYLYDLSKPAAQ